MCHFSVVLSTNNVATNFSKWSTNNHQRNSNSHYHSDCRNGNFEGRSLELRILEKFKVSPSEFITPFLFEKDYANII